ncbi:MAG TPA: MutS2/Smr-associated SH3 domain-containing protein [Chitinophagaceae bacterium]|nr:MutS2/Smr-associated SH3 domain-containing protein [Chitinophagaceae bacterium]
MKIYPSSADRQMEFDKIRELLIRHCETEYARVKAAGLPVHTDVSTIETELRQSYEYLQLIRAATWFPNDHVLNLSRQLRLLAVPGAVLAETDLADVRKLAESIEKLFRWFDAERKKAYPALAKLLATTHYEKKVREAIDAVLDEAGLVRDNASPKLHDLRQQLYRKRAELRRVFSKIISRLNKQGYLAEIEESFMNGRRVVAIVAEQKRIVKGILHGESDSGRTAFVEPEETIELNNLVFELEREVKKEVFRILKELTAELSVHAGLLESWHRILGEYDFIRGKARLAVEIRGQFPSVTDRSAVHLKEAYHPLLYLYNQRLSKPTVPVSLYLSEKERILVISGPNAGGKTVTLKTVGLLQMMVQAGLLVPVHPSSQFGIFRQLMIHIGDTQSLEFELSTYSSHLLNMKYFMEHANGRTLFFIDELGSGSDPNLGGAFAEVILLELLKRHAYGIVTTHYLNLKLMAGKTEGIVNGAMAFDEERLQPEYRLLIGKPGSSYTFSIAERIGLNRELIERARVLVDQDQFRLDKLLNRTEQGLRELEVREQELARLLKENEALKKDLHRQLHREKHEQQLELLKEQNRVSSEQLEYLKDMERKLKQILLSWRKEENKSKVIQEMEALLTNRPAKKTVSKAQKRIESQYFEVGGTVRPGDKVKVRKSHQVGEVLELRGKRAVVKIGVLPMQLDLNDLVVVREKTAE